MSLQLGTVVTTSGKSKICCLLQKRAWGQTASRRQNLDICLSGSSARAVNHCSTLTRIQIIFVLKLSLCQAIWESLVSSRIFSAVGHGWQSYRSHIRVRCRRERPKSLHQPLSQAGADLGSQTLGKDSMMLLQLQIHRQWRGGAYIWEDHHLPVGGTVLAFGCLEHNPEPQRFTHWNSFFHVPFYFTLGLPWWLRW